MITLTDDFRAEYKQVLLKTYMAGWPDYLITESDIALHVDIRYLAFRNHMVPWIKRCAAIEGSTWVEVGSGTGSSTLALAEGGATVRTFELSGPSTAAAHERFRLLGMSERVVHEEGLFGSSCNLLTCGQEVDGVLLAATLEHMTFDETQDVLRASWDVLKKGGLLVVGDTPNRLTPMDYHTSHTPFFMTLPLEVRERYAKHAKRQDFATIFSSETLVNKREDLIRWGNGISYHEFELALGMEIHQHIVATGFENEITSYWPITFEDGVLMSLFKHYDLHQNIGFTRANLFLIFKK